MVSAGMLVERKRRVEREKVKEGLRVWLERKAGEIRKRRKDGVGVGILVWRFSKRVKISENGSRMDAIKTSERMENEKVLGLKRFWEGLGGSGPAARAR